MTHPARGRDFTARPRVFLTRRGEGKPEARWTVACGPHRDENREIVLEIITYTIT